MPHVAIKTVSFGAEHAGLDAVGYAVDGGPRIATGIEDLGSGVYGALVCYESDGEIVWDTGGGSPVEMADALAAEDAVPGTTDFTKAVSDRLKASASVKAAISGGVHHLKLPTVPAYPCLLFDVKEPYDDMTTDDVRADVIVTAYAGLDVDSSAFGGVAARYLLGTARRIQLGFWHDGAVHVDAGVRRLGSAIMKFDFDAFDNRDLWLHVQRYEFRLRKLA